MVGSKDRTIDGRSEFWHIPQVRRQTTIGRAFSVAGAGLHTGRRSRVTVQPAPADHGRRITVGDPAAAVPIEWSRWVPSKMSTSIDVGGGRTVRTVEHLMASLAAFGIDNVLVVVAGAEIPILDGSARGWCRHLREVGVTDLDAPARRIRIRKPVQIAAGGGFLRAEPGDEDRLELQVTHDVLPAFPVMGWQGPLDTRVFESELAAARSFGNLHRLLGRPPQPPRRPAGGPGVMPNERDPTLVPFEPQDIWTRLEQRKAAQTGKAPLLRGARPWRATLVVNNMILFGRRFVDEPVRHVTLDMIGDLTLAGAPLVGRVVAHNPSHEKTYVLVEALMRDPDAWEATT